MEPFCRPAQPIPRLRGGRRLVHGFHWRACADAFFNCSSLKSVTIEEGVPAIGFGAFCTCTALESITIPDTVLSIGPYAFYDDVKITSIAIPSSVTAIGDEVRP